MDGQKFLSLKQADLMKLANNKFGPVLKVENLLALLKARMNPAQARFLSTIHKTSWKLRSAPIYRTGQTSSRLKTKENIYCCCITYYLQEEKEDKKFKSFSRDTWYVQWYVWKSLWSKKTLFFCTIEINKTNFLSNKSDRFFVRLANLS